MKLFSDGKLRGPLLARVALKINCRRFLGRLSTKVMTPLLKQIHSETNIFLSTKVI